MDGMLDDLREIAGKLAFRAPAIPVISNLTGMPATAGQLCSAEYWVQHARAAVRFRDGIRWLAEQGVNTYLELGPQAVLSAPARATLVSGGTGPREIWAVVPLLERGQSEVRTFTNAIGRALARVAVAGQADEPSGPRTSGTDLPTYPFQRTRYWLMATTPQPHGAATDLPQAQEAPRSVQAAPAQMGDRTLREEIAALPAAQRHPRILRQVLAATAAVTGGTSGQVDPERPFLDLGFDSLMAVELCERLNDETGLSLPDTLAFDHPSPAAVADYLHAELTGAHQQAAAATADVAHMAAGTPSPAGEPIAIVAMACRYPGGVRSPEDFWELLVTEGDAMAGFPLDRGWDLDRLYDPDGNQPGTAYTDTGGFLYDAGEFDPAFFDISPREALAMDPQQRLLLLLAWEAMERACIDPVVLRESDTGVFVGTWPHQYGVSGAPVPDDVEGHLLTGTAASVSSGRISYTFGLRGPAITVDTACSSSLVAIHLACQALRSGECAMALAGGATVMATPTVFIEFSRQRGLAPDGRCKPFAAAADGTAWGEGAALILLEPLSAARRNGHRILGVIRGSAVNQDGSSNGLTAPNGPSQERVIQQALASAGLRPADVDAVEAHGTGTTLGDPIEAQALIAAYGQDRDPARPLLAGSVKSNIGHTQAAAGVAGVIKLILAMRHGLLPRTLHIDRPTPHVDWSAGTVRLITEPTAWPGSGRPRRAAVSSFGISGTNAHLIIEQAPEDARKEPQTAAGTPPVPWLISGKTATALRAQADQMLAFITGHPELSLDDAAYTLATARRSFDHRAAIAIQTRAELISALEHLARDQDTAGLVRGTAHAGKLGVVFTGGGMSRFAAGRGLYDTFPVFAREFDALCAQLDANLDHPLREVLFARPGTSLARMLSQARYARAALFAFDVAVFRLLEHFGLRPGYLLAESTGGLAAAHVASVLSLPDAAALVTADGTIDELRGATEKVAFSPPAIPIVSGLTGKLVTADDLCAPDLWLGQAHGTARLRDGIQALSDLGVTCYLTLGPEPLPASEARKWLPAGAALLPVVRPGHSATRSLTFALAAAHCHGQQVAWGAVYAGQPRTLIDLPTYAFDRKRFWLELAIQDAAPASVGSSERHPLISAAMELDDGGVLFTGGLSIRSQPWLADHAVLGKVVVPGVTFLELAAWAGGQVGCGQVAELTHQAPLIMPERGMVELQLRVMPSGKAGRRALTLRCREQDRSAGRTWSPLATGIVAPGLPDVARNAWAGPSASGAATPWPPEGAIALDTSTFYEQARACRHYGWGPAFQSLRAAWKHGDDVYAELRLPVGLQLRPDRFALHPALLDAAMHALGLDGIPPGITGLIADSGDPGERPRIPFLWNGVTISSGRGSALRVRISPTGPGAISLTIWDEAGQPAAAVESLVMLPVSREQLMPVRLDQGKTSPGSGRTSPDVDGHHDTARGDLAGLSADERGHRLLSMVISHVATVSGHPADSIDPDSTLFELGLDSLMIVELAYRLADACELSLPADLAFEHPTPAALTGHLESQLAATPALRRRAAPRDDRHLHVQPAHTRAGRGPKAGMRCFPSQART
jgi:acyl transferase domain-containing protein